jgi:hypothetical protein
MLQLSRWQHPLRLRRYACQHGILLRSVFTVRRRLRRDPVKAAVVAQIFAWYPDPRTPAILYRVVKQLTEAQIPTHR